MRRIRFRPQARAEIREARGWYEGQLSGLGRAFIAELDTTLSFVRLHPQMSAVHHVAPEACATIVRAIAVGPEQPGT